MVIGVENLDTGKESAGRRRRGNVEPSNEIVAAQSTSPLALLDTGANEHIFPDKAYFVTGQGTREGGRYRY